MFSQLLLIAITSFGLSFGLSWAIKQIFPRLKLMDRPHKYGHKRAAIPYPAGIVFLLVFTLFIFILFPTSWKLLGFSFGICMLTIMSFIDDRIGLSPYLRLFIQFLVASLTALCGIGIETLTDPLGRTPFLLNQLTMNIHLSNIAITVPVISYIFTVIWVILFINTLNWMDEPGIVSGVSSISFFIIFLLSLFLSLRMNVGAEEIMNAKMVSELAIVGMMMTLAFLFFDFPPSKMLMGDTGTVPLGYILAVLAIIAGSKVATLFLVLGFPVMDAILVIIRRIIQKKNPLKGDLGHFHHRLTRLGFSDRQRNLILYIICLTFGLLALLLSSKGKFIIIIVMIILSVLIELWVMQKEKQKTTSKEMGKIVSNY